MRFNNVNYWAGIVLLALIIWAATGGVRANFSPGGLVTGLLGAIFSLMAGIYFLIRRTNFFSAQKGLWANLHISLGSVGVGMILIHTGGIFFSLTGLLTLALTLLFLLGFNLRFLAAHQSYRSFFSRLHLFSNPAREEKSLNPFIREKETLLQELNPRAAEGTYSLRWKDWIRNPRRASRYLWLVQEEKKRVRELCGRPPAYLNFSQSWGRYLHIGLGVGMAIGFLFHLFEKCFYFSF